MGSRAFPVLQEGRLPCPRPSRNDEEVGVAKTHARISRDRSFKNGWRPMQERLFLSRVLKLNPYAGIVCPRREEGLLGVGGRSHGERMLRRWQFDWNVILNQD